MDELCSDLAGDSPNFLAKLTPAPIILVLPEFDSESQISLFHGLTWPTLRSFQCGFSPSRDIYIFIVFYIFANHMRI